MINVIESGVVGDARMLNTEVIQGIIDRCTSVGGGTLVFPPGVYLTGGLVLGSNITLVLENGAVLLGSPRIEDYPAHDGECGRSSEAGKGPRSLLAAVGQSDIRVLGGGVIDGQGGSLQDTGPARREPLGRTTGGARPSNVWFCECRNITLDGVKLRSSGAWMQHYEKCSVVRLMNLDVWNHGATNNDGIDIDGCRDVHIIGCRIDSGDDAICLKSRGEVPTEDVLVRDCITRTHCNHFKLGTESAGGFRNIHADGLVMVPSDHLESPPETGGADHRGACGIALGCVDGGCMENITIGNVTMDKVRVPFFVRLGDRRRGVSGTGVPRPAGCAKDITLRGVLARGASSQGCFVIGLPDAPIRNVRIQDCDLEFEGGGGADLLNREIAQHREAYPAMEMFGMLPAWGVFGRDVEGLYLSRTILRLISPDARNALMWHRCRGVHLTDVLEESRFHTTFGSQTP